MNMPSNSDIFKPTRRRLLTTAPMAGLAAMMAGAMPVRALTGEIIEKPYLHEIDAPMPEHWSTMKRGDMLLIIPGLALWDDTHLLRSGAFAAVQVFRNDGLVHIHEIGTEEKSLVTRERANEIVAGHIGKRIRLDRGRWVGGAI